MASTVPVVGRKNRKPLSRKALANIRAGQEKRWAEKNAAKAALAAANAPVATTVNIPVPAEPAAEPVKAAATTEQVLANA